MKVRLTALKFLLVCALGMGATLAGVAQSEHVIRPLDVLQITIWNQRDLPTRFTVEPDGTIVFPFILSVKAAGLSPLQLAAELKLRLQSQGFFKDPQVAVAVEQLTNGRVFVFGGVGSPGAIPLTPGMTILEALTRAGYNNASEAVIVRTKGATGPVLPGQDESSEVIRINMREFEKDVQSGTLSRNILLTDGDTVYVPRVDPNRIFVTGEVRTPGAHSVPEGTTVLQAITLAGGVTENASTGRIRISRLVKGERKNIKVKLDDLVLPGDTIVVPQRFF